MNSSINDFTKIAKIWADHISSNIFFTPILGPVYSSNKKVEKILFNILINSKSKKFLSYDKNKRWFKEKPEKIIIPSINIEKQGLFLASQDQFSKTIKIYYYSQLSPDKKILEKAKQIAKKSNKKINYNHFIFYCFKKPKFNSHFNTHNIYLKQITKKDQTYNKSVKICFYNDLSQNQQSTFSDLGNEVEHDGLKFLWHEYLKQKKQLNLIICAVNNSKIIGAIGPLDVSIDAWGVSFLHPPYFGVLNNFKRTGIGKKLWSTAMNYAFQNKARYTLVQNIPNSPAAHFYEKQGLKISNQVFSCSINA